MSDSDGVPRRAVLAGAVALWGCASLPPLPEEDSWRPPPPDARWCDHDLCRYFVRDAEGAPVGRCSLLLPEAFR
jgi:hypothetical protein